MKDFALSILTPEREVYSGTAQACVFDAPDGEYCILADHAPFVSPIAVGEIDLTVNGVVHRIANSEGFIEVLPDGVTIFVQTAEHPEEIDANRARRERDEAKERLRQKQSIAENKASRITLAKAMARLRVIGGDNLNN